MLWFPEGTWNLTDSLPVLPMKWGIADVAMRTGARIVPMALEYDRKNMVCSVLFGEPLSVGRDEDKAAAMRNVRDVMAGLRWELWESAGVGKRADLIPEAERETTVLNTFS